MDIEVAVVVIIQNTPAVKNGIILSMSMDKGRSSFKVSVPVNKRAPDKTHPMMGPMMVLVT